MKISVLGLGLLGKSIAKRLLLSGFTLSVYNRTSHKTNELKELGAHVSNSPKELADNSDILLICVTDYDSILEICNNRNGGLLESNNTDVLIINTSTITSKQANEIEKLLQTKGFRIMSMPVMGGPKAAEKGELIPIISGNINDYVLSKSLIEAISTIHFYTGEGSERAFILKLALNLNIAQIATALSEGIIFTKKSGVDPSLFLKILNSTYFKTGISENKGQKMIDNNFDSSFYLKNMLKDLNLVLSTANEHDIKLPATENAQIMFNKSSASGYDELDYTGILKYLSKINGLNS